MRPLPPVLPSVSARWTRLAAALAAVALAGCTVGPRYQRPPIDAPAATRGEAGPATPASLADQAWWDVFRDDALKGLIAQALANGYDVRLAAARVEEARANAGIVGAERFPSVQLSADWTHGRQSQFSATPGAEGSVFEVNLGLSWEADLWGRIRRLNEAALAQYLATEEARRGVFLTLASDVATSYFQIRELDEELAIARRTTGAFQETFDLFDRRLRGGTASGLETASAAASLASTAAVIPDLERQIVAEENHLALLLGRNPGPVPRGVALADQFLPPDVPPGIPSDLLRRRPDLREAEQNLVAANAQVGAAQADFFPRISLTGAFGGVAPEVGQLFSSGRAWSVGPGVLAPVFQGQLIQNRYRAAVARWNEAKVQYEQSVTNAFGEVSTALVAYQKLADVERERAREVAAYRDAVRLSTSRYTAGLSSYLEVLQAQQQLFPAELQLAQARFSRLSTLVQLYRALGGGWQLTDAQWAGPGAAVAPAAAASTAPAKGAAQP